MIQDSASRGVQERLAANTRRLRIARHLSLSELARATAMSKATLSGIENGQANPTVDTLAGLAAALRIPVVELLDEPPLGEVRVSRAADAAFTPSGGLARRTLETAMPAGESEVAEIALDGREIREVEARREGARVGLYVLEGTLIAGPVERSTELAAGDYMSFPGDVAHVYEAGRRRSRALVLTRMPS